MIYRTQIITPANTPEELALVTPIQLTRGIIHLMSISFPAGPQDLCHCRLFREGSQMWPSDPDDSFAWEDHTFTTTEYLPIEAEPYMMWARTWNESTKYPHRVIVRFAILPRELLTTKREELGILQRLERLIFGAPTEKE